MHKNVPTPTTTFICYALPIIIIILTLRVLHIRRQQLNRNELMLRLGKARLLPMLPDLLE